MLRTCLLLQQQLQLREPQSADGFQLGSVLHLPCNNIKDVPRGFQPGTQAGKPQT